MARSSSTRSGAPGRSARSGTWTLPTTSRPGWRPLRYLQVRAGETGRLFGAVTPSDIVTAVQNAGGPTVDKRRIEVSNPIKTVGAHTVTVRLHPEVAATVQLDVVAS